jgi:hypothetical protein
MRQIIIKDKQTKDRACRIINDLDVDGNTEVVIRKHKMTRSAAQNSLLWKWYTVIALELGESKEEVHERYKGRFLVPIYERDDSAYAEMIEAVREVWRAGKKKDADILFKQIVKLTSTTTASVKQKAEYLNDIDADARSIGIRLPYPEDIYYSDIKDDNHG